MLRLGTAIAGDRRFVALKGVKCGAGRADAAGIFLARIAAERRFRGVKLASEGERLALAAPDAIVMHPGPMNRGVEIASAVADGPQSVILDQVQMGVFARMAVLIELIAG